MDNSKLNGAEKQSEQPQAERVGFAFSAPQWDMVSGLAAQLMESTQRTILEQQLRLASNRLLANKDMQATFVEEVASLAANQAFATARHYVAHQVINAERIAQADIEAQDAARREAEERRRKSMGLPPQTTGDGDDADSGDAQAPRIVAP